MKPKFAMLAALAAVMMMAGCSSTSPTAEHGAPGSSATSTSTTVAQPAAHGVEAAIADIPWPQVGPGWMLATWSPVTGTSPGEESPPNEPTRDAATTTLYLVDLTVELTPQGTLAERLRAGGSGIGAFFTPTGVGTLVAERGLPWRYHPDGTVAKASPPKEVRTFGGQQMVLEEGIVTDYAIIRAAVVDKTGNCQFHAAARNFNPPAAISGRVTVVEAERVDEVGELHPNDVHLPGVFVKRIVALTPQQATRKDIEKRTTRPWPAERQEATR
jgi:acyl CoA:acetate/3-ketoacid CoA transferase alpha subunit